MRTDIAWAACGFFVVPGALCILVSYGALRASKREGRHISGMPVLGGLLVGIGFLLSPCKWLALLALLDYGIWGILWSIVCDILHLPRRDAPPHDEDDTDGGTA